MALLQTIGQPASPIHHEVRETVKVVIKNDNKVLLLNKGLLPGGGIDPGEPGQDAINCELQEELGVTVKCIQEIGAVIQYRNLLKKKYLINGYTAELATTGGPTSPQDEGEAQFTSQWLTIDDAMEFVAKSIEEVERKSMNNDANQGKLYNLLTTSYLLRAMM